MERIQTIDGQKPIPKTLHVHLVRFCLKHTDTLEYQRAGIWINKTLKPNANHCSMAEKLVLSECMMAINTAEESYRSAPPLVPPSCTADRIDKIFKLSEEIELLISQLTIEKLSTLFITCEKRRALQWKLPQFFTADGKETPAFGELSNIDFSGEIEHQGPGYATIRSPLFRETIQLLPEDVVSGALIRKSRVSFRVQIKQNDGRFILFAVEAQSASIAVDVSGLKMTVPEWEKIGKAMTSSGKPVLIDPEKLTDLGSVRARLEAACPINYTITDFDDLPASSLPSISSTPLKKCLFALPMTEQPETIARIRHAIAQFLFPLIAADEKSCWSVVIDETGKCLDHRGRGKNPSVMMAVIIPPGVQPLGCSPGYHSIEPAFRAETKALRQAIIDTPSIICCGWRYESANPYHNELHPQMWRHAITTCLEIIAQRSVGSGVSDRVPVNIYIENVGPFVAGAAILDQFHADLLERVSARDGWRSLKVNAPIIIGKDGHPSMGYVDALGHVFRPDNNRATAEEVMQASEILARQNTLLFPFHQGSFENLSEIIRQSGHEPVKAIMALASSEESLLRPLRSIARGLIQLLIPFLDPPKMERLMEQLQVNLTRTPALHFAAALILGCIRDLDTESMGDRVKVVIALNRLAGCNFRGDTVGAAEHIEKLNALLTVVREPHLQYRFAAQLIDYHQNNLDFEAAYATAIPDINKARMDLGTVDTAAHVLGADFVTKGLCGETEAARAVWDELFRLQRTYDDKLRYYIYLIHLNIDLDRYADAWETVAKIKQDHGSLVNPSLENYYLLAAVLKLQAYEPRLLPDECNLLLSICPPHSHPGELIAFWGYMVRLQRGETPSAEGVREIIEICGTNRCNALRAIHACLRAQIEHDGAQISGAWTTPIPDDLMGIPLISTYFKRFPPQPEARYGLLTPLKMNFK